MKKFEYKKEHFCSLPETDILDEYGKEGWEFITVEKPEFLPYIFCYFKRKVL